MKEYPFRANVLRSTVAVVASVAALVAIADTLSPDANETRLPYTQVDSMHGAQNVQEQPQERQLLDFTSVGVK